MYQFRAKVRGILHKLVLLFALKRFALKLLDKSNEIEQEIDLLRKLNNHKHIVKYVDDFIDNGFQCIITEFCEVRILLFYYSSMIFFC